MTTLDKCSSKYDNYILLGDLNFDLLDNAKCSPLNDIMDVFDLSNMVMKPTCFTFQLKVEVPSNKTKWCSYRSFKDFNADMFNLDLQSNLSKLEHNDVNTMCNILARFLTLLQIHMLL